MASSPARINSVVEENSPTLRMIDAMMVLSVTRFSRPSMRIIHVSLWRRMTVIRVRSLILRRSA